MFKVIDITLSNEVDAVSILSKSLTRNNVAGIKMFVFTFIYKNIFKTSHVTSQ